MKEILGLDGLVYEVEVVEGGVVTRRDTVHNIIPAVARSHIAGLILGSGPSPISNWYIGIYEGNYTPTDGATSAILQSTVQECVAYEAGDRPQWSAQYDGTSQMVAPSAVEFEMNAAKTVYGGFVVSNSSKGGSSGVLLSIVRFTSPYPLTDGAILRVRPYLSIASVQVV